MKCLVRRKRGLILNGIFGKSSSLVYSIQKGTGKDKKEMVETPGAVDKRRDVRVTSILWLVSVMKEKID